MLWRCGDDRGSLDWATAGAVNSHAEFKPGTYMRFGGPGIPSERHATPIPFADVTSQCKCYSVVVCGRGLARGGYGPNRSAVAQPHEHCSL